MQKEALECFSFQWNVYFPDKWAVTTQHILGPLWNHCSFSSKRPISSAFSAYPHEVILSKFNNAFAISESSSPRDRLCPSGINATATDAGLIVVFTSVTYERSQAPEFSWSKPPPCFLPSLGLTSLGNIWKVKVLVTTHQLLTVGSQGL